MMVSLLPSWAVLIIAVLITAVYYFRHRKTKPWMGQWWVLLTIFAGHFLFFAWGIMIFLISEAIRYNVKKSKNREKI